VGEGDADLNAIEDKMHTFVPPGFGHFLDQLNAHFSQSEIH
jgi:hypothetical protein